MNEKAIQELLDAIEEEFVNQLEKDQYVRKCLELLAKGKATHEDAYDYALSVASALSKALDKNITEEMFDNGELDFETLKALLLPTYKQNHDLVDEYCQGVQRALNEKAKIGLAPAETSFKSRRVVGLATKASQREFFRDVRFDIEGPYLENFCQNTVDDNIMANVDLHGMAGLRPKVIRLATGNCCKWCQALEGSYIYPDVPEDVYHRHKNCRCTVAYDPGDGSKKDVWSKKYYDSRTSEEIQKRVNDMSNREAAKRWEASRARDIKTLKELKDLSNSGIINIDNYSDIEAYFSDNYGLKVLGFEKQSIEKVKVTLAGVDDVIARFPGSREGIKSIVYDPTLADYGRIDEFGNIRIGYKGLASYGTGIHESIHAFDQSLSSSSDYDFSERLLKQARKNLGLRSNSKDYIKQTLELCGYDPQEIAKSYEVLAYAIETELGGGNGNKLSKELLHLLEEQHGI